MPALRSLCRLPGLHPPGTWPEVSPGLVERRPSLLSFRAGAGAHTASQSLRYAASSSAVPSTDPADTEAPQTRIDLFQPLGPQWWKGGRGRRTQDPSPTRLPPGAPHGSTRSTRAHVGPQHSQAVRHAPTPALLRPQEPVTSTTVSARRPRHGGSQKAQHCGAAHLHLALPPAQPPGTPLLQSDHQKPLCHSRRQQVAPGQGSGG